MCIHLSLISIQQIARVITYSQITPLQAHVHHFHNFQPPKPRNPKPLAACTICPCPVRCCRSSASPTPPSACCATANSPSPGGKLLPLHSWLRPLASQWAAWIGLECLGWSWVLALEIFARQLCQWNQWSSTSTNWRLQIIRNLDREREREGEREKKQEEKVAELFLVDLVLP